MNYELTQEQVTNFARIVAKAGQDGWRIKYDDEECTDPSWDANPLYYAAERIKIVDVRAPLPQSHYKRSMQVRTKQHRDPLIVLRASVAVDNALAVMDTHDNYVIIPIDDITDWAWPNTSWQSAISITPQVQVLEILRV